MTALVLASLLTASVAEPTAMTGTVSVVRRGPVVAVDLKSESGERIGLSGPYVAELKRLNSYRVWVSGTMSDGLLRVEKYNLLEVGGIRPILGVLVLLPEGFALSDGPGKPTLLAIPPKTSRKLRGQVGATIWVTGQFDERGVLTVKRYGLIKRSKGRQDAVDTKTSTGQGEQE